MKEQKNFLGIGWSFPPEFKREDGLLVMVGNEPDIEQSLHILLSTSLGERIMVPKYGCNLEDMLFQPLNLTIKTEIEDRVKTAILYHEPRIDAEQITIDDSNQLEGEIIIDVNYRIRATNSRKNFVFPFYIKEATNLI